MGFRHKLVAALAFSSLALAPTLIQAKEFFVAYPGANGRAYSSITECTLSAPGKWAGGCHAFYTGTACDGWDIYVDKNMYKVLLNEYNDGEQVTFRYLNSNGSFGSVICTFN